MESPKPRVTFEMVPQEYYPDWGFREKTPCFPLNMNFIFLNGGMGDYITWMQPIRWLASEATWIRGTLIFPTYFKELAAHWLKPFPKWGFKDYAELKDMPTVDDTPFRGPLMLQQESLNATGAHLLTCGWVYFTNKEKAPPGWEYYPQLRQAELDTLELPEAAKVLEPGKYAVITTGITTPSRRVPGKYWNYVIEYVKERGLTPVFLGKSVVETGNLKNIHTEFDRELRIDLGVDLRDGTSLLQAASIMSRAAVVIGHDNGLLHLAGCTDVPIVFGYNLASPEHRQPRRQIGKVFNVTLTDAELACNHCQSKTNFVIGYNFQKCFYNDNKCIDLLFANKAQKWKDQIDLALSGEDGNAAIGPD